MLRCLDGELRVDAFLTVGLAGEVAEEIPPELRDQADLGSQPRRGHRLVRSLAARPEPVLGSHDRLSPGREALRAERKIRHEAPHERDPRTRHDFVSFYLLRLAGSALS